MIRIISGLCFAISSALFFYNKSRYYIEKRNFLNELTAFISYVKESVRYTRTDVLTIKKISSKKYPSLLFLQNGIYTNCFEYEKEIETFMTGLGKTDISGQMELCERYYDHFMSIYESEKEESYKNSKTYSALGLFSAAAFLVIFI